MRIDNPSISGSLSFIGGTNSISATSVSLTGSLSGTFEGAFSSTATANISGAFDSVSASLASDITANASSINSLNGATSSYALQANISGAFDSVSSSLSSRIASNEGSVSSLNSASSSYLLNTTDTLDGDLTVTGKITAQEFHTEFVSASIIYESGSTQFGNSSDDTHIFSGSTSITGNVGIGVASPGQKLDVLGNIRLNNGASTLLYFNTDSANYLAYNGTTSYWRANDHYFEGTSAFKGRWDAGGNLGIGTTSPSTNLEVVGNGTANTYRGVIRIGNTDTQQWAGIAFPDDVDAVDSAKNNFYFIGRGSSIAAREFSFHIPYASDYGDSTQPKFKFASSGSDTLMTIEAETGKTFIKGNVGIGTTSPLGRLHILAPDPATDFNLVDFRNSGGYGIYAKTNSISSRGNTLEFLAVDYNSGGTTLTREALSLRPEGNVGMGIANPSSKLTVKGVGGGGTIRIVPNSANAEASIGYYQDTTGTTMTTRWVAGVGGWNNTNKFTIGYGNDGSDLTIDTAGKVGIGIASPARMFHVTAPDNNIAVFESDTHGIVFQDDGSRFEIVGYKQTGGTYNDIHLRADVNNTLVLKATSGNVGIGTDSPLAPLHLHTGAAGNGATGSFQDNTTLGIESTSDQYIEMLTSGGSSGQMQGILFSDNGRNAFVGYKEYTGGVANTKGEAIHLAFYDYSASDSNNGIYFGTSYTPWLGVDTTHMFIKGNGNVGIGTATPNSKLDIATTSGTAKPPALRISNASFPAYYWDIWRDNTTGYLNFGSATGGSLTTQITIKDQSGNVGIGTTDPGDKLDVRGNVLVDNGIYFKRGGTDYSTYIRSTNYPSQTFASTSDRYWVELGSKGGTHIVLNTDGGAGGALNSFDHFTIWQGAVDGDKLMVVDNVGNGYYAGKLGIGIESADQKLQVSGNAHIDYSLLGRGMRSADRGELILNATGTNDVSELLFGSGNGYTNDNTLRWGISDRGVSDGTLRFYKAPALSGWAEVMVLKASGNQAHFYGNVGIGTTNPTQKLHIHGDGSYNFNPASEKIDSVATIISDEMTDSAYHSILQLVSVRQSLTTGNAANGFLGFSTIDDSNGQGMRDAARIAIVNENGTARNSATALSFWTNPGGVTSTVAPTEKIRIDSAGNLKSAVNYKSAGWNWVTTPYHYYVATTAESQVTLAVNTGFTVNGNSAIPSDAKALYVTYYYHISGYGLGDGGQGDHANDIWGPDLPATTTSWSFTTTGNYDWGSAVFMHDGDASESGDIAYYGQWFPGAIIPVNANGNIYGRLSHGYSGGTHYHHMYVWGYAL